MTRFAIVLVLPLIPVLAAANLAVAQAPAWAVTRVERSDKGVVSETKINPISGLTETKNQLVFGKKNEFLTLSIGVRPDKKGFFPDGNDFQLVDENGKPAGKQTYFLKGKNNIITLVYRGDWTSLDGLSLAGPGPRSHPLGKKKK